MRPAISFSPVDVPLARGKRFVRPAAAGPHIGAKNGLIIACGYLLFTASWLSLLGPIAPLLMMAATMGIVALAPLTVITGLFRCWPILLVAALAPLSALWSTEPGISFRYGTQLAITFAAAVTLASVTTPKTFLRIVFFSTLLVLLLCLISGRQGGSPQGPVLIGVLGSKNEMGQLCQLAVCSAVMTAFSTTEARWIRLLALPASAFAAFVLAYTFASGAVITTILFLMAALLLALAFRLPAGSKLMLGVMVLMFALPLWLIQSDLVRLYEWFVVDVLGKDIGLTGRDYLWAHADKMISARPVLGYGYRSTWLGSGTETIGLLRWAGLSSGAGFNFHDTYRELAVDLGIAGLVLTLLCLGFGMARVIIRNMGAQATTAGIFLAASAVVLVARAKVETITGPFGSSGILIGVTAASGYLAAVHPAARKIRLGRAGRGSAAADKGSLNSQRPAPAAASRRT
ncbi:O-antigen ligase family protein [Brevundimonas variabilis]|uniref:Exopolysaccharide production protein ExoQ n=1 Tax=Brevundimonas variabilis TaxID=74312 RepID=A0A7W9FEC0_9CAUL|nr:O-antigen ligase family protein [Brevundimonas variabilis]MBB5746336.1 exopolysaccharide production protein ExoQ [Brevundimonas variabilis]